MLSTVRNALSQSAFIPAAPLTEANTPDQTGRIHVVTGGYAGVGEQLARLLYAAHATVYIAGRDAAKADAAIARTRDAHPSSRGALHFLRLDLADLASIAPAAAQFEAATGGRCHVLTNNAGVMFPPAGSKGAQGHELQIATNVLGGFLLAALLMPSLKRAAAEERAAGKPAGGVRVTWAGSMAVDLMSPKGGIAFDEAGSGGAGGRIAGPKVLGPKGDYGQSKCANRYLAAEMARRPGWGREEGIVHYCWNPGNLRSELQRHTSFLENLAIGLILYPAKNGAYTELYSALSPDLGSPETSGSYIAPWGRLSHNRSDVEREIAAAKDGRGRAEQLFRWCEQETAPYRGGDKAAGEEAKL